MPARTLSVAAFVLAALQAQGAAAQAQPDQKPAQAASGEQHTGVEEVIVTANKLGVQLLQDIPASITVIDQSRIEKAGIVDFLDYVRTIPGLGFQITTAAGGRDDIRGGRRLSLRGIESGYDSVPTTAFYLDETPIPVMDPKLFDVERIEVLRGPQGTLYGANSMGGTIRVVTSKPRLDQFLWNGDISVESTRAGEESYGANGMVNIPLVTDKVALRAVASFRNDGGFIDHYLEAPPSSAAANIDRDINSDESWGARVSVLFQLTDRFRITPSIFRQEVDVDDAGTFEPGFRDLGKFFMSMVPERQSNNFTLYSVEASYDLTDRLQLVSSSSYFESDFFGLEDATKGFYDYGEGYGTALYPNVIESERKSQELRLAYNGERFRGVFGAFYMDEERFFDQYGTTETSPVPGNPAGVWFTYLQTNGDEQKALFGEATYDVTDRLSVTGGARWFKGVQDQFTHFTYSLDALPGDPLYVEDFSGEAEGTSVSPKLQVSFDVSDDKMIYTSASRGFRPGGPTSLVPDTPECVADLEALGLDRPRTGFGPDTLWNYELGTKASFANRRFTTNAAVYFIDWKDVQQTASLDCGYTFIGNVGAAESKGVEVEFWGQPTDSLSISGAVGYTDAEFTRTAAAVGVTAGDSIPLVPELTGSLALEYGFSMPTGHDAYFRADYQYVDEMDQGGFSNYTRPSYDSLDLRLGVGLTDHAEVAFFVSNLFDERGVLSGYVPISDGGSGGTIPTPYLEDRTVVRPRTVGVTFRYKQ
jgi:iron complex outermembrane receptor protein